MAAWTAMCGGGSVIFLGMALLFTVLKGKAAILISGFNTMPEEQRKRYDTERMSRDQRNAFIWLIVFLRDVHLDEEKAFGRYKIK